jgi:hypothetical protein
MNGLVSYRGQELSRGDMSPSSDNFEYFEDFLGVVTIGLNNTDTDGGNRGIAEYPGVLVSTAGTDATKTAVAMGGTSGGSISFTTASDAVEGLSIPSCSIDVDAGDWYVEARVKVTTLESTGTFAFGLQEDVSVTDTISQTTGAAGEDVVMMFYDTGTTTDGLLEASVTTNTSHTANTNGAAGMTGAQVVSDTFHRLAIRHDSSTEKVYFYFDGSQVDEVANTNLSDQILHPFILASHDAMGAIVVDYVYVNAER